MQRIGIIGRRPSGTPLAAALMPGATLAILSGPTFAGEVARGLPTAVTLATADRAVGRAIIAALGTRSFRPYLSDDVVGAEIGGAVKNVLAIACGIVAGRRLGDNARAAHHPRPRRDGAAGARQGRARRDAHGPLRARRSDADLHRR